GGTATTPATTPASGPATAPTITTAAKADPATPLGTTISNSASATTTTTDPDGTNNSGSTTTRVAGADLQVSKDDTPDPVAQRGNISYSIQVYNNPNTTNSGVDAASISVSD